MTEAQEEEIRAVVRDELLGIIGNARELIGTKDPTGFGKKALDGLAHVIKRRQSHAQPDDE